MVFDPIKEGATAVFDPVAEGATEVFDPIAQGATEVPRIQDEIGVLQKLFEPVKTFGQAFTQSLAAKPATALRGVTAFTPGEALGSDKVFAKTSEILESMRNPNTKEEIEQKMQGKLFPVQEGDKWTDVDPSLLPEVINAWAANIGDQIPLMLMAFTGKVFGKLLGKPLGAAAGTLEALATGGPDPTDAVVAPAIAVATAKVVEHLGGAAPLVAIEAGGFLDQADQLGIDKDIAEKYARGFGLGSGTIEYAQVLWNLKAFKRLAGPAKKKIVGRILTEIGGSLFEGLEEFSQEGLQNFLVGKAIEEQKARTPDFQARIPKITEGGGRAFAIGTGISLVTRGLGKATVAVRGQLPGDAQKEVDKAAESLVKANEAVEPAVIEEEVKPASLEEQEPVKPAETEVVSPPIKPTEAEPVVEEVIPTEGLEAKQEVVEVETDATRIQELKASIAEGELILRTGKFNDKVKTPDQLTAIRKQVNKERAKIGLKDTKIPTKELVDTEKAVTEPQKATIAISRPESAGDDAKPDIIVDVKTGEPVSIDVVRGSGRTTKGEVFAEGATENAFGEGRYSAIDEDVAKQFGPKIEKLTVTLKNPFILTNDKQLSDLVGETIPLSNASRVSFLKKARTELEKRGHDGLIINIPNFTDTDPSGKRFKRLIEIAGNTQVVEFTKPKTKKVKTPPNVTAIQAKKNKAQATNTEQTVKIDDEAVTISNDEDVPIVENPGHLGTGLSPDNIKVALEPKGKSVSSRDIVFQMERDFDVPFRSRVTHMMRKSIGHFEIRAKVIRAKDVRDLSTATHELGHHLDHNFFNLIHKKPPQGSTKELLKLGKDLYGQRQPPGGYKSEGVAEFIRIWLTDNDAETRAPVFNKWFEEYMNRNSKVAKRLQRTRSLIEKWKAQGSELRIKSQITDKPVKGTVKERIRGGITRLETLLLDKFTPLRKLRDEIGASQLHPSEDPFEVATANATKSGAKAAAFALQATTDLAGNVTGVSLQEALEPVSDDIKNWTTWAVAARALHLHGLGINSGITRSDAQFVFDKFKSPEFEKALKEFTAWNHRGLDYMVEAGAMELAIAEKIKKRHTVYVPFKRAFKEGEIQGTFFGGKGFVETGSPVKKIKGSGRAIKDPISEAIKGMEAMISASQRSQVALAMTGLADRFPGMGDKIVRVPAPLVPTTFSAEQIKKDILKIAVQGLGLDPTETNLAEVIDNYDHDLTVFTKGFKFAGKENVISIVKNGKRLFYEVSPDLFKTLKGLDKFTLPWYLDFWLGKANRALRLGATGINPEFALRNMIRDLQTFGFTSDFAKGNFLSGFVGIGKDIMTKFSDAAEKFGVKIPKSQDTLRFRALGGELSSFVLQDKNGLKHIKSQTLATSGVKYTINTFIHPVDALRNLVGITESGTRIGEFGPALKEGNRRFGKGSVDAAIFALNAAQDVTVNFSKSGTLMQILNQVVPFSNVAVQGPAKLIKTFRKNPIRSIRRAMIGLTIPALWLWWRNKDKEWWKNLAIHEKTNYLHFENPNNPNEIIRFPVAFELGHFFQTIPVAAMDAWYNQDPKAVTDSMKFALDNANPLDWPAAIGPILDVIGNEDFAGRPIVPRSVEGKLPQDQFTPRTTVLAKIIGKQLKMSPAQIEFYANSYSGGMYGRVARMLTSTNQPDGKRDLPVIGTLFMRDPFAPKAQIEAFYEKAELLEQKFRSKKITTAEIRERKRFNKSRKQMSVLWKQLRVANTEKQRRKVWDSMNKLIERTTKE